MYHDEICLDFPTNLGAPSTFLSLSLSLALCPFLSISLSRCYVQPKLWRRPCACAQPFGVGNTAIRAILTVIKFNCLIKREK